MEGLGKKLKEARLARGLTLDDAFRATKIRPNRLDAIENDDFSQFDSLAYSKAALLIYGKFLEVDVTPYLEEFETSETVTVDGYSYLQQADVPEPEPSRPVVVRRRSSSSGSRGSLMPFVIGVLVLVIGFTAMKWILEVQRLKPRPAPAPGTSPMPTATVSGIVAPHAQPVEGTTPPPPTAAPVAPAPSPTVLPTTTPFVPEPAPTEPEVRRAEPVNPQDAVQIPTPTPRPSPRRSPRRPTPTPQAIPSPFIPTRPR